MDEALPGSADVVVVGSGILGAAVACNLAEAGLRVVVLERGEFCGEASGANVGLVTVSTKPTGLLLDFARASAALYPSLGERLGRDVRYRQCGGLIVATTPEALAARRALTEAQRAVGVDVRHVTREEACEIEPSVPETILGGSYCPQDGYVYPFAVVAGYLERARELGVRLVPRTAATGFRIADGRVTAVETPRGAVEAAWVVNAAGAWAGEVSRLAGIETPVIPVRGQVLVTEPMPMLAEHVVYGMEPSIRQTWAGNGVIGSTTERAGYDKENTLATIRHFARGIVASYPQLADRQVIRAWAGLRPGTPDDLPILGQSGQVRGFVLAAGAFRNGMAYGPAIGQVIADEILGRTLSIDIDVARPDRFARPEA